MTMATRLAVMDRGAIMQLGTPSEVYEFPNSRFTAEFLGTANVFEGVVEATDATGTRIGSSEYEFDILAEAASPKPAGARVLVAVRPERMAIARAEDTARPGDNRLIGTIADIAYFGDFFLYHVALEDGRRVRVSQPVLTRVTARGLDWEDRVAITWPPEASVVLPE